MALTAFLGAAFLTALLWLERPNVARSLLFGCCTGLAVLSKFSSLAYFPSAICATAVAWFFFGRRDEIRLGEEIRRRLPTLALAIGTGLVVIWAGYRFSFHTVPAPELFQGVRAVLAHNRAGHPSYLLGQRGPFGWWYFFPVVLAVKTPLAVLLLLGVWAARRRFKFPAIWIPAAFSLSILLVGMSARIDIGVRHVLPIYLGIAILAACAVAQLLEEPGRWARRSSRH